MAGLTGVSLDHPGHLTLLGAVRGRCAGKHVLQDSPPDPAAAAWPACAGGDAVRGGHPVPGGFQGDGERGAVRVGAGQIQGPGWILPGALQH
jgi:hypothetical protein